MLCLNIECKSTHYITKYYFEITINTSYVKSTKINCTYLIFICFRDVVLYINHKSGIYYNGIIFIL